MFPELEVSHVSEVIPPSKNLPGVIETSHSSEKASISDEFNVASSLREVPMSDGISIGKHVQGDGKVLDKIVVGAYGSNSFPALESTGEDVLSPDDSEEDESLPAEDPLTVSGKSF